MTRITEDMRYSCFAAARRGVSPGDAAESFVDVEEYENQVMYPEFARRARQAGYPGLATLFMKVAEETCALVSGLALLLSRPSPRRILTGATVMIFATSLLRRMTASVAPG